jgi:D-alanyl-D-alanine carboxypeptidase/D-alanyl-D-alanine-endopeptidase (penicillin-binding protein 4)
MKKNFPIYLFILSAILFSCSASYKINRSANSDILKNQAFVSAHTGISIYDPEAKKYLYNYQGNKYFVPASNTKLFTCYAAMKYLGDSISAFRYLETNDTIYVIPDGDPTFLGNDFSNQPAYDFLKNTNKIIVLNTELWSERRWGNGWAWNDYNDDYSAERSVMPVYENLATFDNGSNGIRVSPSYFSDKVTYQKSNSDKKSYASVERAIASNNFFISGNDSLRNAVQIPFFTANDSILKNILEDTLHKRIYIKHTANEGANTWKEIHSQSTDSLLKITMHRSDNFFAEQTLLLVSAKLLTEMNDEKIIDTLLKTDYDTLPLKPHWVDGSGLSHYNLFSPQDFVILLSKMKNDFGMDRIKHILPTGGTGTLRSYYKNEAGYIFAKTGSLSGVVALTGFLYTKKNKLLIFSVLINNHRSGGVEVRKAIEKFIESVRDKN